MNKGENGQKSYRQIEDNFDVNDIAMNHGGGGHPGAASVNITEFQKEEDTYLVKFKYKCSPAGVVAPITYHAKIKLKTDITDKTKWANRVENPLGIIVDNIEYFYENSELANDPLNTDITALSNNGF